MRGTGRWGGNRGGTPCSWGRGVGRPTAAGITHEVFAFHEPRMRILFTTDHTDDTDGKGPLNEATPFWFMATVHGTRAKAALHEPRMRTCFTTDHTDDTDGKAGSGGPRPFGFRGAVHGARVKGASGEPRMRRFFTTDHTDDTDGKAGSDGPRPIRFMAAMHAQKRKGAFHEPGADCRLQAAETRDTNPACSDAGASGRFIRLPHKCGVPTPTRFMALGQGAHGGAAFHNLALS